LFAVGPLLREALLLAPPISLARLPARLRWRAFVPAAALTLVAVVLPLSRGRAVHPNALYPSVVEDARRAERPLATLAGAVASNVAANLHDTLTLDPAARAEDAGLLAALLLAALAALGARRAGPEARRLAAATLVSLALLTLAVLTLYVVRERGGVWGGVRAYMAWMPLLLVLATPLVFAPRRRAATAALCAAVAAASLGLDRWQVRFFNRYKGTDLED